MALTKVIGRGLGVQGDTVAGDDAALGFTSTEGLIITGQGSTNDVTIKNDADAQVCAVPTGTDDLRFPDAAQLQLGTGGDFKLYHDGSNNIVLGNGSHPMAFYTNDVLRQTIDANGHITQPYQPAFFAEPSSTQSDIATNSLLQVGFATERFDQNSDYNPTISTFTAPVTGKYQFNAIIRLDNIDTAASYYLLRFTTSNRDHTFLWQPKYSADPQYFSYTLSSLADMDASDTCVVKVYQTGGSQQTDINNDSRFSGYLVA